MGAQAFSRGSFTDTPMNMCLKNSYVSEPAIVTFKPPAVTSLPMKLCCASSAESLESESSITEPKTPTGPTLLKIKKAFTESGIDPEAVVQDCCTSANMIKPSDTIPVLPTEASTVKVLSADIEASRFPTQQSFLANEQNITFGQIEMAALSPLHIDSVVLESGAYCSLAVKTDKGSLSVAPVTSLNISIVGDGESDAEQVNCSRLIDALDIQSPANFKLGVTSGLQSTPYKPGLELRNELSTPPRLGTTKSMVPEKDDFSPAVGTGAENQQPLSPNSLETEKSRVADHIQHFNNLTLHSPRGSKARQIRSPLKFHRTPVRQTVRRMNSLLDESRRPTRTVGLTTSYSSQVVKAVSLESGLSPHPKLQPQQGEPQLGQANSMHLIKKPPPVLPKKPSTLARKPKPCALGDVTNKVQPKTKGDSSVPDLSGAKKPLVEQVVEKDMNHYRGSPRNPLNQGRLLSATKPVDL